VNLAEAILERDTPGDYIKVPFPAMLDGEPVTVTAVLRLTAVYHCGDLAERHLALQEHFVPTTELEWNEEPGNSARFASERGRRFARQRRQSWAVGVGGRYGD